MGEAITFKGNPVTLRGRALKTGMRAPDFRVLSQDLKEVTLSDFTGKVKIISTFISLDTSVCDLQVKEFNRISAGFSPDTVVIGISKDLPFAQKRFCQGNNINNQTVLSDYRYTSFGINYGLLIEELNLLARSVQILDKFDILRYSQIVREQAAPPDYEDALKNLESVIRNPGAAVKEELPSKCKKCAGGVLPMSSDKINSIIARYKGWELVEGKKIVKEFKFKDFNEAKLFLDLVAVISEEQAHHPTLGLMYNRLKIILTTHAAGGLTENDFIMAKIIDELGGAA